MFPNPPSPNLPDQYLLRLLNHPNSRHNHKSCDPLAQIGQSMFNSLLKTHCCLSSKSSSCPLLKMRASKAPKKHKRRLQQSECRILCCSCRYSVSSSEESESINSDRFASISSLAHAMVQERLDQLISAKQEARHHHHNLERRNYRAVSINEVGSRNTTKFVVMIALEKSSHDPREDFRGSMIEMITSNKIEDVEDLRSLLNYYLSMNSDDYHGVILQVFHEVCTSLFLRCKCRCR